MAIVLPAFTTSAVITSATLISQTDEQLNILMTDVKNYVQDNYKLILSSLGSDIEVAIDTIDEKLTMFERVYLGAYNTDPLLDNEGFPLVIGAMYFNTVSTVLKVYSGTVWISTITLDVFTKSEVQNSLPAIGLDTSLNTTPNVGQMTWNQDDYTANLGMPFGITQQVGQELYMTVKNTSGHLLSQAKPVMATGTTGNSSRILCDYYDTLQASAMKLIGVTTHDIANGTDGLILTFGKIHNIDTTGSGYSETWANGDILYISSTVLGGLTNIQPAYGTLRMPIGYVIHAHTNGSIFVRIQAQDENALVNTIDSKLALKAPLASPTFTGTVTAPTFSGALSGNASTATKFSTSPTINGVAFDGSTNINIEDRLGTVIVSAATTSIGTTGGGNYRHISGTTTITSFGNAGSIGMRRTVVFEGALTLTHNASTLICPGGVNITTLVGTIVEVIAESLTAWRVIAILHPSVSFAELGYLDGLTENVQAKFNTIASGTYVPVFTGISTDPTFTATNIISMWTRIGNIVRVQAAFNLTTTVGAGYAQGSLSMSLPVLPTANFTTNLQVCANTVTGNVRSQVGSKLVTIAASSMGLGTAIQTVDFLYTI